MSSSTRQKILQAAHRLIISAREPDASMAKIADAAGVSRQALYLHFDSRSALMLALVHYIDEQLDLAERFQPVAAIDDPCERLLSMLEIGMRLEPDLHDASFVFDVARHSDEAIAEAFENRMGARRRGHLSRWESVAEAGRLREGWSPERASQATWAMTIPSAYRAFVVEAGWELDRWVEYVLQIVKSTLLTE